MLLENIYDDYILLPEYKKTKTDKKTYAESFLIQYQNTDSITAKMLVEPYGNEYVVQNKPSKKAGHSLLNVLHFNFVCKN